MAQHEPITPALRSIMEAKNFLGVGRNKIYDLLAEGRLTSIKLGRRNLIKQSELEAIARGER